MRRLKMQLRGKEDFQMKREELQLIEEGPRIVEEGPRMMGRERGEESTGEY